MRWRAWNVIVILCLIGACIPYRLRHQQVNSASRSGLSQPEVTGQIAEETFSPRNHPALALIPARKVRTETAGVRRNPWRFIRSDLECLPSKWIAADGIEAEARALLDDGFRLMRVGNFRKTRRS
jgi:hypothetical protein